MFDSITKAALIQALKEVPDDGVVAFSSNYGDYHRTEQAHEISGEVEERTLRTSAYSTSGFAVSPIGDDDEEGEPVVVWIIS